MREHGEGEGKREGEERERRWKNASTEAANELPVSSQKGLCPFNKESSSLTSKGKVLQDFGVGGPDCVVRVATQTHLVSSSHR